jgi:hypothetical protein
MTETSIADGANVWLKLAARTVRGQGTLLPRLVFDIEARPPRGQMLIQIQQLQARLVIANEVAGTGAAAGILVGPHGNGLEVEIPISPSALDFAEAQLTDDRLRVTLELRGLLWAKDDSTEPPRYTSQPNPGEWTAFTFGGSSTTTLDFEIARSDWYSRVREPLGTLRYLFVEIPLPSSGDPLRKAAEQLKRAERALTSGDEPGVFLYCRGAIDALPGSPKKIFDGLANDREAKTLDDLVLAAGNYLHRGRHVERSGDQQGDFPVTSRDARFALNLTKVVISHAAQILASLR